MKTIDLGKVLIAMAAYAKSRACDHHNARGERTEASIMYSLAFMLQDGAREALNIATDEANVEAPAIIVHPSQPVIIQGNRNDVIDQCLVALEEVACEDSYGMRLVREALLELKSK